MNADRVLVALAMLENLIKAGGEYPKAEFQVIHRYKLNTNDVRRLQALYDQNYEARP